MRSCHRAHIRHSRANELDLPQPIHTNSGCVYRSAAGTRPVIPLAEKLVRQVMIVVVGTSKDDDDDDVTTPASLTPGWLGVATDVDAYLRFSVAGGRAEGREGRPSRRGSQQPYVNPQTAASCSHHQKCDSLGLEGVCCKPPPRTSHNLPLFFSCSHLFALFPPFNSSQGPTLDGISRLLRGRENAKLPRLYNSPDCGEHLVAMGATASIQLDGVDDDNHSEQALSPRRAAAIRVRELVS